MDKDRLEAHLTDLLQRIEHAGSDRGEFAPKLTELLHRLDVNGNFVPAHLRQLEQELHDEALEDDFDNLPI